MRRIKLLLMLTLSTMLLSLSAGTGFCSDTGKIALRQRGWPLSEAAYVVPIAAGRETVELIETQAAEIAALRAHIASADASMAAISADVAALESAHENERAAWSRSVEALQKAAKKYKSPWAIGLFGGWDAVHQEACVGVGLTFRLFGF